MKYMKYRQLSLLVMVSLLSVLVLTGCSGTAAPTAQPTAAPTAQPTTASTQSAATATATDASATASSSALKTFTASELAKYDGQNGNPAYIAVDGKVYDVSNVPEWKNGSHAGGRYQAGKDYSAEMAQAPHGKSKLDGLTVVGTYVK
jgi:predicted heme/steroid binding protein